MKGVEWGHLAVPGVEFGLASAFLGIEGNGIWGDLCSWELNWNEIGGSILQPSLLSFPDMEALRLVNLPSGQELSCLLYSLLGKL